MKELRLFQSPANSLHCLIRLEEWSWAAHICLAESLPGFLFKPTSYLRLSMTFIQDQELVGKLSDEICTLIHSSWHHAYSKLICKFSGPCIHQSLYLVWNHAFFLKLKLYQGQSDPLHCLIRVMAPLPWENPTLRVNGIVKTSSIITDTFIQHGHKNCAIHTMILAVTQCTKKRVLGNRTVQFGKRGRYVNAQAFSFWYEAIGICQSNLRYG